MEANPLDLEIYQTADGSEPFVDWLEALADRRARISIKQRLNRVELGNLGDSQSVGDGVFEFRIDYGPGYRVYFARSGLRVLLLLCGGDKSRQSKDILQAKQFWTEYKGRQDAN
jgi:putative addiction module killer protein